MSAATLITNSVGRSGRSALLGGIALAALISTMAASQAQVTNGTFSQGVSSTYTLSTGTTSVPSWSLTLGHSGSYTEPGCMVDGGGTSGTACSGSIGTFSDPANESGTVKDANGVTTGTLAPALPYVAVMVDNGAAYDSTLSQSISLTANATYTLSFLEAATEGASGENVSWTVAVGNNVLTGIDGTSGPTTTISLSNGSTTNWVQENYTFTDTGSPELLSFISSSSSSGPPVALLDSVSITKNTSSVPEPATLAVLGLGIAGLYGARRKRAASGSGPGGAAAA